MKPFITVILLISLMSIGCQTTPPPEKLPVDKTIGTLLKVDPRFDTLIAPGTQIEVLASGFEWAEGPVWVKRNRQVLFSDIPNNVVNEWSEAGGLKEFLKPAGYTGADARGGEPGSNGLTLDSKDRLVLCEHGDRRVSRLESDGTKTTLADKFQGKRFNSPNDLVYKSNGDLYFTDPPYGLEGNVNDPKKEIPFQGVYRLSKDGEITLLTSQMSRPNGIAFSPDEKTLYVANSDPNKAIWMAFPVYKDGTIGDGKVLFDATGMVGRWKGLPDGLKIDRKGNLFATGPGGVLVLAPDGTHLGTIRTGEATANCGWGDDGTILYITADMHLLRIRTLTKGRLP